MLLPRKPAVLLFAATAALGCMPLPARGQNQAPVASLVESALRNNPGLKAQRMKVAALDNGPSQARALPDPTADVEFMMLPTSHLNAGDVLTKGVSVGLTQELPYPGKRKLEEAKAIQETEAARAELWQMANALAGEVESAAYRYALDSRLLELNARTSVALEAAAKGAAGVYSSGGGTQTDLLLAQAAITKNDKGRLDLEQERAITAARLDDLLGGEADRSLLDEVALSEPGPVPDLGKLLSEAVDGAPKVAAARALEQVESRRAEIAKKAFKPDFTVGGRYRHNDVTMGGGDYFTLSAGMTLQFFHRKDRYQPALEAALAEREGAKEKTSNALNEVRYELTRAWQNGSHDLAVYRLIEDGLLIQSRQAYESSLASYATGKTDFATLLSALVSFYGYQGEALSARADCLISRSQIDAILGNKAGEKTAPSSGQGVEKPNNDMKENSK